MIMRFDTDPLKICNFYIFDKIKATINKKFRRLGNFMGYPWAF